ncbi:hypothetical protein ACEPPN_012881 [Leptodophora sp. 'Broadleaf-Isolate-01']
MNMELFIDLHMQNILVTDRYYPHDLHNPHDYEYITIDIREGKVLSLEKAVMGPTNARSSYGAVDFRAPEASSTPVSDQCTKRLSNLHNSDNAHGYAKAFHLDDENV